MYRITWLAALVALAASPCVAAGVADRVWVSGHGVDQAGCGAPTAPCRSLQYAHDDVVVAGGEIDILDPAGYGSISITKSVSIVNDGVGTAGVQATTGSAITIAAGSSDNVYLRGLSIDGVQAAGATGIDFRSGAVLTVVNCVARHFRSNGMLIEPTSGSASVRVYDSLFLDDGTYGVAYDPESGSAIVTGVIDHVRANGSNGGVYLFSVNSTGSASFVVSNSDTSGNSQFGMGVEGANNNLFVEVNSSISDNNGLWGLSAVGAATVHVARSIFDANLSRGIDNQTSSPGAVFSSSDNHLEGNPTPIGGATPTPETLY